MARPINSSIVEGEKRSSSKLVVEVMPIQRMDFNETFMSPSKRREWELNLRTDTKVASADCCRERELVNHVQSSRS